MEHSRLGSLPAELRVHIYGFALYDPGNVTLDFEQASRRHRRRPAASRSRLLALTQTCKQIRNETLPAFFTCNDFVAKVGNLIFPGPLASFGSWIQAIGFENLQSMKHIRIEAELGRHRLKSSVTILNRAARLFAGTGAQATLSLTMQPNTGHNLFDMMFTIEDDTEITFVLPLHNLQAAGLELRTTAREHCSMWQQQHTDGVVSKRGLEDTNDRTIKCADLAGQLLHEIRSFKEYGHAPSAGLLHHQAKAVSMPKRRLIVALRLPWGWAETIRKGSTQ